MSFWICADEQPTVTHFYYFTKEFSAPAGARLTALSCGDTRYQLWLNGHLVCEGPCQGSSYVRYYEDSELSEYLVDGVNRLTAKVLYLQEGSFISVYRGARPSFWMDGTLTDADGQTTSIGTDGTWTCTRDDATIFHHMPGVHTSVPPFEEVMGGAFLTPVGVLQSYAPDLGNAGYNIFGLGEYYPLAKRPIPQMKTHPARPTTVVREGRGWIELDAGIYTTAKVNLDLCGRAGSTVRIIYSECYVQFNEQGHPYKAGRDDHADSKSGLPGVCDMIHTTGHRQHFAPFWYRSFRYIRIEYDPDAEFTYSDLTYAPYFYPLEVTGSFTCSDDRYDRMWEISRNTVMCCMHEMYVDCPFYEQQQYDMDSCLEMLFTMRLSSDSRMPYKSLTDLAHSQMADGMLQANYPSTMVQIIPDFTLFWVLMLREYQRTFGSDKHEIDKVRALTGTMDKALNVFENYMTKDGLIGPTPYWPFVDWVPTWPVGVPVGGREEPLTVTCLMYAAALKAAAEVSIFVGRPERASEYTRRADEMIGRVNTLCYDREAGLYRNTPTRRDFSQHTTLWAILSGAVTGDEAGALVDRTFDGHEAVAVCTFSMNHFLFRALEKAGRYEYAPKLFDGWHKMMDMHCTTWCENPDSPRSECHGWSSAPIYELSEMILGVYPSADGFRRVTIKPCVDVLDLETASGTVPTPFGLISVSWKKQDGRLLLDVSIPDSAQMEVTVIMPDGMSVIMNSPSVSLACRL